MTRKTLRDLGRQKAQAVAVGVTVLLGVALFLASAGAFGNLSDSYQRTYDRLRFADLVATGGSPQALADAARTAGAADVVTRTQAGAPLLVNGAKLVGRVVGLPADHQPAVDAVDVVDGGYLSPGDADGVLLERHAATTFGLNVGDGLDVFTGSGWHRVTVRGLAVSAEYLWPARSRQDVLGDPHAFAVVFAAEDSVRRWAGTGPNQVLVRASGAGPGTASAAGRAGGAVAGAAAIADALRAAGAVDVAPRRDQPSDATLREDLNGFSELAVAFPLLFLTAAAVAAYVLLARRVLAERPVIGALMAFGARRGRLVRHYLQQGLVVGALGGAVGVVAGLAATGAVTRLYTRGLSIPDTVVTAHPALALAGLVFGAVVGLTGAAVPAMLAARTAPADAMRNRTVFGAPGRWSRAVSRLRAVPVAWRMALRDVFRSPRRTLATMLGTVLALVLVLASTGMFTSLTGDLRLQFGQIERQDATVATRPGSGADPAAALRAVPGVSTVEATRVAAVTAGHGRYRYPTQLRGFDPDTRMHGFRAVTGGWRRLPEDGLLAGAALADRLHVRVGDELTLSTSDGATVRLRLAGLLDEPLGTALYATNRTVAAALPDSSVDLYLVGFQPRVDRDRMRRAMTGLPDVVSYADADAVTGSLDRYLGLFWSFIAVMVLLGAVLAFAVIYVTMAVNVVERTNELATLRAAGVARRRVAGMLAAENMLATVLGIPVGLALGVVAARAFLSSFSNDLFRLHLSLSWWVVPAAALGVLLAAALSQWPAARAVARMDIARVVRERAQ